MNRLFLQFSNFFPGCGEPQITETVDTESADMGDTQGSIQHCGGTFCLKLVLFPPEQESFSHLLKCTAVHYT
jgi:hypothetical protein